MDELTRAALAGTSRGPDVPPAGAWHTELAVGFADVPAERRVLLSAGVRAAVRMAAQKAGASEAAIEPCPPETQRPCSPRAARIIGDMLYGRHADLLPEALGLLRNAGQRLPHAMLVDALGARDS